MKKDFKTDSFINTDFFFYRSLEGTMEEVRLDVVNKKRVENPKKLHDFEDEIILLSRNLADTKSEDLS